MLSKIVAKGTESEICQLSSDTVLYICVIFRYINTGVENFNQIFKSLPGYGTRNQLASLRTSIPMSVRAMYPHFSGCSGNNEVAVRIAHIAHVPNIPIKICEI
jgi:hypothetical protein